MTKSNEDKSSWLQLGDPMDLESAGGYRRTSGGRSQTAPQTKWLQKV